MTLVEILALGNPQALALKDWGQDGLKYLAWGPDNATHVATALFDPNSLQVQCLEIFDPEGLTWCWRDPSYPQDLPGTPVDTAKALSTLSYLMRGNDPILTPDEDDNDLT